MLAQGPLAYHVLKASLATFGREPAMLAPHERESAEEIARRSEFVEGRILASAEASEIEITDADLASARLELVKRYSGYCDFVQDLEKNGLDESKLHDALDRQLRVEATLKRVDCKVQAPTDREIAEAYMRHRDQFSTPESRRIRHIVITVNEAFPENTPEEARRRAGEIHARLTVSPGDFEKQAERHSECPSALHGGDLGYVATNEMLPGLKEVASALRPGEISAPTETEIGFHIVRCDEVVAARRMSLDEARPVIVRAIMDKRCAAERRRWIGQCCGGAIQSEAKPCHVH